MPPQVICSLGNKKFSSTQSVCYAPPGIYEQSGGEVTYIHLLFNRHEIVFANDAPSESFFAGEPALNALEDAVCDEVLSLFPELKIAPIQTSPRPHGFASTTRKRVCSSTPCKAIKRSFVPKTPRGGHL
ncbi:MAG TPA: hypothetical protein DHC76_13535 [Rhodobacteraceae bacterium]|uniref:Hint domain-containing protein n=1 Tax=Planktotalea sp. TaxID=2029877 RepID=UPI000A07B012|nr:hypothetical protein [Paracoccaceae bacterium]